MFMDSRLVEQARNADMIVFLGKHCGFTFSTKRGSYRCKQHPSLAIKDDRRSWYWHSKGVGGYGVLDYLTKVENVPFRQAVDMAVTNGYTAVVVHEPPMQKPIAPPPKQLILPEKAGIPLRLLDYLCNKRGIDSEVVSRFIDFDMLFEDRRKNVVFVGKDEDNKPRFASLRGTQGDGAFRGDCSGSDKRYGFHMLAVMPSPWLYIFESPIDLMSHASLNKAETGAWENVSRLSLSGTSDTAMPFFLNRHKFIKELVFCLDNDTAGREAAVAMARKYADKGYVTRLELPRGKDFNEDLQVFRAQTKAQNRTKTQHNDVTI